MVKFGEECQSFVHSKDTERGSNCAGTGYWWPIKCGIVNLGGLQAVKIDHPREQFWISYMTFGHFDKEIHPGLWSRRLAVATLDHINVDDDDVRVIHSQCNVNYAVRMTEWFNVSLSSQSLALVLTTKTRTISRQNTQKTQNNEHDQNGHTQNMLKGNVGYKIEDRQSPVQSTFTTSGQATGRTYCFDPEIRTWHALSFRRWLYNYKRFDFDSTVIQPHYYHSTTYVSTVLLQCGINK